MGRIANKHLAKLWDFMANYNYNSDEYPCDILEAFLECDEALSELQDQCDHWKTMYGNACGDQDVLKESIRLLDTANKRLEQKARDQEKEIMQRRKEADGLYKELDRLRDEKGSLSYQKIRDQEKEINQLRTENDDLKKQCEDLRKPYIDAIRANNKTIDQLQKEHDELKKDCAYMTNRRDTWRTRAEHAEAEVEKLKKNLDLVQHAYNGVSKDRNSKAEAVVKLANKRDQLQEALDNIRAELEAKVKRMDEITNVRDTYISLYDELKKDYVKLSAENRKLNARTDCLRMEVEWYRKHYKEKSKAVEAANINISTSAWHGDATAEKIKFEPWSCTLEGTINVEFDRDLLEKVCGVKPDDKK